MRKTRGATTIILTILVLNVVLVIGLGIGVLMTSQIKASQETAESVAAFYAADAGAERCLYAVRKNGAGSCPYTNIALDFSPEATYTTVYNGSNTITSIGRFRSTSRKVELTW